MTDLRDRLIEVLLWEELGGEKPPDLAQRVLARAFRKRRRLTVAATLAFAAALVACITVGWLVLGRGYPAPRASGGYEVVGGGDVRRGSVLRIQAQPATLILGGYSRVEIKPNTTLRIEGEERAEGIFLDAGEVQCEVNRDVGTFAVRTEVGAVSVTGTRFIVRVAEEKGDREMIAKRMAVRVLLGTVLVSGAWGDATLSQGEERAFTQAGESAVGSAPATPQERASKTRVWDTGKTYTQKYPCPQAFKDRANWVHVPYGTTAYQPRGDLMLEGETFYLFLFTNKDDSVELMTKLGTDNFTPNELYKVHQDERGLRNFGMGTMKGKVRILKNTAEEIVVEHAGEGRRHGKPEPIVTTYRVLAGKPWLEVRPVERVNQQGMHGKARLCAFVKKEGDDFILDSKREPFSGEVNVPAPPGTIGIINFRRGYPQRYDFMWFMTFPPGAEKHPLTYLGFHADPFWEDPPRPDRPSVGAQYAYLGEGGVFIASLNDKDNWKREDVGREVQQGEVYTTRFKAPYAGEWKMVARLAAELAKPTDGANLVKDPGAEGEARANFRGCDFPLGWGCYNGAGTAQWGATAEQAHGGKKSNAVTLGATAGYSGADAFDAQPNTTYRFSFWLKGKGFKGELNVYGQGWKDPVDKAAGRQNLLSTLSAVRPTDQWQQYEGTLTTAPDTRKVALFIQAYGNKKTAPVGATVWVDDVSLGPATETTPSRLLHSRVRAGAGTPFTFRSPAKGTLDYLLIYLWDRTEQTPKSLWTPMDVYREVIKR